MNKKNWLTINETTYNKDKIIQFSYNHSSDSMVIILEGDRDIGISMDKSTYDKIIEELV